MNEKRVIDILFHKFQRKPSYDERKRVIDILFHNFQRSTSYESGIEIGNTVEENNALLSLIEKEHVHITDSEEVSTLVEEPPIEEIIDEGSPLPLESRSLGQHNEEESFHEDTQLYEEDMHRNFEHENDQK
jgi:hypothetical protein